jgi:hypothetical protein
MQTSRAKVVILRRRLVGMVVSVTVMAVVSVAVMAVASVVVMAVASVVVMAVASVVVLSVVMPVSCRWRCMSVAMGMIVPMTVIVPMVVVTENERAYEIDHQANHSHRQRFPKRNWVGMPKPQHRLHDHPNGGAKQNDGAREAG